MVYFLKDITDKMLSKELKELEVNKMITKTVHDTFPPMVEYSVNKHGQSLDLVITSLRNWGIEHRKEIIGQ
ncbi:putative HTH-type transcriptional regulator YtcD [compost metagenome]